MLRLPIKEEVYYSEENGVKRLFEIVEVDNKYYTLVHQDDPNTTPCITIHRGTQDGTKLMKAFGWDTPGTAVVPIESDDMMLFAKIKAFSWLMRQFARRQTYDTIVNG